MNWKEVQVRECLMEAMSDADIAKRLGMAKRTVKKHLHSLCQHYRVLPSKTGHAATRVRLAVAIYKAGDCHCANCLSTRLPQPSADLPRSDYVATGRSKPGTVGKLHGESSQRESLCIHTA